MSQPFEHCAAFGSTNVSHRAAAFRRQNDPARTHARNCPNRTGAMELVELPSLLGTAAVSPADREQVWKAYQTAKARDAARLYDEHGIITAADFFEYCVDHHPGPRAQRAVAHRASSHMLALTGGAHNVLSYLTAPSQTPSPSKPSTLRRSIRTPSWTAPPVRWRTGRRRKV